MTGSEMKKLRKESKLSLAGAARLLNVSARSIARWEASAEVDEGVANFFLIQTGRRKPAMKLRK